MGTIVDGAAKAKKMEPKLLDWLIEGIEKCNVSPLAPMLGRMYSIEDTVYSPVPSITNHKAVRRQITKHGRSNHHFTLRWLRFSLIFFKLTTCCFCRCSASCGTRIGLVKHWHVGPHVSKPRGQRRLKIRNLPRHPRGKITSFLLILIL